MTSVVPSGCVTTTCPPARDVRDRMSSAEQRSSATGDPAGNAPASNASRSRFTSTCRPVGSSVTISGTSPNGGGTLNTGCER
ncbi:conserved hypothetical protein [Ricinus communis]|uniref:Uncharacterized protein n=1 Tax=Ricinus communis TaxID=3988 RepID=B9TEZ1_RICCO|nr:conserved hypothetical protein [Ricinus communis]